MIKEYNIFISHAWDYCEDYYTVKHWLDQSGLHYKNYSVPQHDRLEVATTKELEEALTRQIKPASVVVIIAGMYAAYSDWIDYEIDEAVKLGKTIIGIMPRGHERIPQKVKDNAKEIVKWRSEALVSAIKRHSPIGAFLRPVQ